MVGGFDGCWIDIISSCYGCYDRVMFKTCTNKNVLLGVAHTTNVVDIREVELNHTSEKTLIFKDLMHTPDIIKILVSGFFRNKTWFSQFIGVNLYTISHFLLSLTWT